MTGFRAKSVDPAGAAAPVDIPAALQDAVLRLNNAHAAELSLLDPERLRGILDQAFHARVIGHADAFLIAFDETAAYDSPNHRWFRARHPRFVYVDRIAVAPAARGRGLAKRLYADLVARAREAGHGVVTCEVNSDPPNPVSDAFHAALGFAPVGTASIHGGAKTVRYLELRLAAPAGAVHPVRGAAPMPDS